MRIGKREREVIDWIRTPARQVEVGLYRGYFCSPGRSAGYDRIEQIPLRMIERMIEKGLVVRRRSDPYTDVLEPGPNAPAV
jgi:hypothetical protein